MRRRYVNKSRALVLLDGVSQIKALAVDRNVCNLCAGEKEGVASARVTRVFNPGSVLRVKKDARGQIERLLSASDDNYLLRIAVNRPCSFQMTGDACTEREITGRIAVGKKLSGRVFHPSRCKLRP